jgi:hypothetical protein
MAKAVKITKSTLVSMLDEKITGLNLLKAALQAETHLKQADLDNYLTRFKELLNTTKK